MKMLTQRDFRYSRFAPVSAADELSTKQVDQMNLAQTTSGDFLPQPIIR